MIIHILLIAAAFVCSFAPTQVALFCLFYCLFIALKLIHTLFHEMADMNYWAELSTELSKKLSEKILGSEKKEQECKDKDA